MSETTRPTPINVTAATFVKVDFFGLMPEQQAADFIGVTRKTLENDRRTKSLGIPYIKLGTKVRYSAADLLAYIEANRVRPATVGGKGAA